MKTLKLELQIVTLIFDLKKKTNKPLKSNLNIKP